MPDRPVALVTGASGGIGEAFARELAARGHDLVCVARSKERLEALAGELPVEVEVLPADLTDPEQLAVVERRLGDEGRPVDVLVNNAGFGLIGRFQDLPVDDEDEVVRLNVLALTRLAHVAVPGMVSRRRGAIVNVSSIAGFQPTKNGATYGATKAYVISLSLAMREDLRGTGVKVVVVCPGLTRTGFQDRANFDGDRLPKFLWHTPEAVARASLRALDRNDAVLVPGAVFRAAAIGSRMTPWSVAARLSGLFNRPR